MLVTGKAARVAIHLGNNVRPKMLVVRFLILLHKIPQVSGLFLSIRKQSVVGCGWNFRSTRFLSPSSLNIKVMKSLFNIPYRSHNQIQTILNDPYCVRESDLPWVTMLFTRCEIFFAFILSPFTFFLPLTIFVLFLKWVFIISFDCRRNHAFTFTFTWIRPR